MNSLSEEIQKLKEEQNAVIMAHYYVPDEVQEFADYIGDSFYLSKVATKVSAHTIIFAGVYFMGESAKILNPEKTVLLPDESADCPMAHMAENEKIQQLREKYEDLAVVCYINSTAELKTYADVCVTSANAVNIVKALPNKHIYFIPDQNLGSYVAKEVPETHIILNDGFCPVHHGLTQDQLQKTIDAHPRAKVLVHPECTPEICRMADMVGSTSQILKYASSSMEKEFIIGTEAGIFYELKKNNPDKTFYPIGMGQVCMDMKKITPQKILECLRNRKYQVEISDEIRKKAIVPLMRMLELA